MTTCTAPRPTSIGGKKEKYRRLTKSIGKSLGEALKEISLTMQRFISKHLSGMCGVGKFLQIWKEQDTAHCPRCNMLEDAPHVWRCPSQSIREIWQAALHDLERWMLEVHTDPVIAKAILQSIQIWLNLRQQEDQTDPRRNGNSDALAGGYWMGKLYQRIPSFSMAGVTTGLLHETSF
jgi:Zn ribbon nucleic-acid-binding protein